MHTVLLQYIHWSPRCNPLQKMSVSSVVQPESLLKSEEHFFNEKFFPTQHLFRRLVFQFLREIQSLSKGADIV